MTGIKSDVPYQPISCDLHSQYELAIMHKDKLSLTWHKEGGNITEMDVIPVDVQTKNKAEYLVVKIPRQNDLVFIRLDYIIEMHHSPD